MNFRSLASSSAGCCYVLSGGGTSAPLLIECGISYSKIQLGMNFRTTSLAGCLISHSHKDHCLAARDLMTKSAVRCYASAPTRDLMGFSRVPGFKELTPKHELQIGDWNVLPFEVPHDQDGTLGFMVASPDGSVLAYATDCAYLPNRFSGVSILALECNFSSEIIKRNTLRGDINPARYARTVATHMSIERLIPALQANDLSNVREIHLLHLSDANSDEADFMMQVRRATGKPVYVAGTDRSTIL